MSASAMNDVRIICTSGKQEDQRGRHEQQVPGAERQPAVPAAPRGSGGLDAATVGRRSDCGHQKASTFARRA